jgi:hypothetical protein
MKLRKCRNFRQLVLFMNLWDGDHSPSENLHLRNIIFYIFHVSGVSTEVAVNISLFSLYNFRLTLLREAIQVSPFTTFQNGASW